MVVPAPARLARRSGRDGDAAVVLEQVLAGCDFVDRLLNEGDSVLSKDVAGRSGAGLDAELEARDEVVVDEVAAGACRAARAVRVVADPELAVAAPSERVVGDPVRAAAAPADEDAEKCAGHHVALDEHAPRVEQQDADLAWRRPSAVLSGHLQPLDRKSTRLN